MRRRTAASCAPIIGRSAKSHRTIASSVAPASIGPMGVSIVRSVTPSASLGLAAKARAVSGGACRRGVGQVLDVLRAAACATRQDGRQKMPVVRTAATKRPSQAGSEA